MGGEALGLDEDLVRILFGEAHHLVLDRGAIAHAGAFDHAGVERRTVECAADDVVGAGAGVGDPAAHLARMIGRRSEVGKDRAWRVAGLLFHPRPVDAAPVDARRRAGLEAVGTQRQFAQAQRQRRGGGVAGAAAGVVGKPDVDLAGQEGADGEHDAGRIEAQAHLRHHAAHLVTFERQILDRLLEHGEVGLGFHRAADRGPVELPIGLAARGAHRRALGGVEGAPLDAGAVGGACHDAAERVDFLHQMALADPADRRIAAHLADGVDVVGEQQRARAAARRGQRRLGAGVAAADHDHVELFGIAHDKT